MPRESRSHSLHSDSEPKLTLEDVRLLMYDMKESILSSVKADFNKLHTNLQTVDSCIANLEQNLSTFQETQAKHQEEIKDLKFSVTRLMKVCTSFSPESIYAEIEQRD